MASRPGAAAIATTAIVVLVAAMLEAVNFRNQWLLFEDVSATAAPVGGTVALWLAGRDRTDGRRFRRTLAAALGIVAVGQMLVNLGAAYRHS